MTFWDFACAHPFAASLLIPVAWMWVTTAGAVIVTAARTDRKAPRVDRSHT